MCVGERVVDQVVCSKEAELAVERGPKERVGVVNSSP